MSQKILGVVVATSCVFALVGTPAWAQRVDAGAVWTSRFGGNARVVFGTTPVNTPSPNRMPYRDSRDNAICIAPESLAGLGISARVEGGSVKLTGPDNNLIVTAARQGPFERAGGVFVDAVEVLKTMGLAALTFEQSSNTLILRSILREVSGQGDAIRITAGLPITPKITIESEGLRATIDFSGATIGELPKQLGIRTPKVLAVRTLQLDEDTARLVLDFSEPLSLQWREGRAGSVVTLMPPGGSLPSVAAALPPAPKPTSSATVAPKSAAPAPMVLRDVAATSLSDDRVRFSLQTSRLPAVRPSIQDGLLTLDLGNVYLAETAKSAAAALAEFKHPLIKSAQLVPVGASAARLLVSLASNAGYSIRHAKGGGLLVELLTPRKTEGPLVGRTIVVDPGHGGGSSGNPGHDGTLERTLTLPMALSLARTLEELGANVILTRDSNFDPGLVERAIIANRVNADLFVSVHCNDGSPNRSIRGAEVYYHANLSVSRDVAKFIGDKVRQNITQIPVRAILSDYRIYPRDGFAVLRNSQMASVLVETGYMSNSADYAALKNPDVQTAMGVAIAQGIADFFAANPDPTLTRFVNPVAQRDFGFPPRLVSPDNNTSESSVK